MKKLDPEAALDDVKRAYEAVRQQRLTVPPHNKPAFEAFLRTDAIMGEAIKWLLASVNEDVPAEALLSAAGRVLANIVTNIGYYVAHEEDELVEDGQHLSTRAMAQIVTEMLAQLQAVSAADHDDNPDLVAGVTTLTMKDVGDA